MAKQKKKSTIGKSRQLASKIHKYFTKAIKEGRAVYFEYPDYCGAKVEWSEVFSGEFVDYIDSTIGCSSYYKKEFNYTIDELTEIIKAYYRNSWSD